MMLAKQAISKGASPWTATVFGNVWIAVFWGLVAAYRGELSGQETWLQAALVGFLFVLGQVFTYLAFQVGDISVAAPVMGVKVLLVAMLSALLTGQPVATQVWIAAAMATMGIALVQMSSEKRETTAHADDESASDESIVSSTRTGLSIVLAIVAVTALSIFDLLLQRWGPSLEPLAFLPVMFVCAMMISLFLLPWVDSPFALRKLSALRLMLSGTFLMALQAMSMSFVLTQHGDAARVNIVYALRGMWGVIFAWWLARFLQLGEADVSRPAMIRRLIGATLLTLAVVVALLR